MSNADWYAQRLAQARGQQPAPPVQQPPQYPPTNLPAAPGQLPAHLAPYATPPVQQPQNMPGARAAQPGQVPQSFTSYDANTGAQAADDGTVALLYHAAADTGGSALVKANTSQCPNCGGTMFAKTLSENGMPLRTPAMPQCGDCNYPVVQAGSQGGALKSAKAKGPARFARQLPSNHQVTVMDGGQAVTYQPPT